MDLLHLSNCLTRSLQSDYELECVLIGTGGMMPMPYRMLSSMAIRLNGEVYLFDAGEGTQINWKKASWGCGA